MQVVAWRSSVRFLGMERRVEWAYRMGTVHCMHVDLSGEMDLPFLTSTLNLTGTTLKFTRRALDQ